MSRSSMDAVTPEMPPQCAKIKSAALNKTNTRTNWKYFWNQRISLHHVNNTSGKKQRLKLFFPPQVTTQQPVVNECVLWCGCRPQVTLDIKALDRSIGSNRYTSVLSQEYKNNLV